MQGFLFGPQFIYIQFVFLAPILVYIFTRQKIAIRDMKNLYLATILLIMGLSGCSSQKKIEAKAPFTVENATCESFVGGREESGSGFVVKMPITAEANTDISYQKIYFRGHILSLQEVSDQGDIVLEGVYHREDAAKPDIIMHADPKKEVGNQPPKLKSEKKDFPFSLNPDQAIVEYTQGGDTKYFMIEGIKDKSQRILPGRPNN